MTHRLLYYLERTPPAALLLLAGVLVGVVGALDLLSRAYLSFVLFYLLPIGLAAWAGGRRAGAWMAGLSASIVVVDQLLTRPPDLDVAIVFWNAAMRAGVFLVVARVLAALKAAYEHEHTLAQTDALTGTANGRAFFAATALEIERLKRYGDPLTLAFLDLDNFKAVNDHFGHTTGDLLLRMVAGAIKESIRSTDLLARLGGDEFVILMRGTGPAAAQVVAERIQQVLLGAMRGQEWPVTASIGVVICTRPPPTVGVILHAADDLLYKAKAQGKNRIHYGYITEDTVFAPESRPALTSLPSD